MPRNLHVARPGHLRWLPPILDPLGRWAGASAVLLAAAALQLALPAARAFPFVALFPAIPLCAWIAGLTPALVMAAVASGAAWWFLMRPPGALDWPNPAQAVALLLFLCGAALTAALVDGVGRTGRQAERDYARAKAELEAELARSAELHHRTANTLQLASSAMRLTLQPNGSDSDTVRDAARRLDALGRYHRLLLDFDAQADPADVMADLARAQLEACGSEHVALRLDLQRDLRIDRSRLGALAMIVSEGICNALKHAFPQARPGHIFVRLRRMELGDVELEIRDDGAGPPDGQGSIEQQTAGLPIVQSLARQIGGTATFAPATRGTVLRVMFPEQDLAGGT